jgi:TRAP-type C4-dicarboxylate transport system permease small subunit
MTADAAANSAGGRAPGALLRRCARWDAALANAETVLLAVLILGSLAASLVQIGLRNLGLPALPETDTVVRRAVLWIAFLGASLAAFRGSHLAVDVAGQVLPARANRVVSGAAGLIAAGVTALLTVAAARFVVAEFTFAGPAGAAAAAVIPLGFVTITLRFLLASARHLIDSDAVPAGGRTDPAPGKPKRRDATSPLGKRRNAGGGT